VAPGISIDTEELHLTFERSGGPGGQNVNKLATRATLRFNINTSASLADQHKRRLRQRLGKRISQDGILRVVCSTHRTQAANRRAVVRRFQNLLADALHQQPRRRPTTVPRAVRKRRLQQKRQRGQLKRLRSSRPDDQ